MIKTNFKNKSIYFLILRIFYFPSAICLQMYVRIHVPHYMYQTIYITPTKSQNYSCFDQCNYPYVTWLLSIWLVLKMMVKHAYNTMYTAFPEITIINLTFWLDVWLKIAIINACNDLWIYSRWCSCARLIFYFDLNDFWGFQRYYIKLGRSYKKKGDKYRYQISECTFLILPFLLPTRHPLK
jgi:hypothetical protein